MDLDCESFEDSHGIIFFCISLLFLEVSRTATAPLDRLKVLLQVGKAQEHKEISV